MVSQTSQSMSQWNARPTSEDKLYDRVERQTNTLEMTSTARIKNPSPWSALGQLALLIGVVALIYLIFWFGTEIPGWAWIAINAAAVLGVVVCVVWLYRTRRARRHAAAPPLTPAQTALGVAGAVLLVIGLTLPIWITLAFVFMGFRFWR